MSQDRKQFEEPTEDTHYNQDQEHLEIPDRTQNLHTEVASMGESQLENRYSSSEEKKTEVGSNHDNPQHEEQIQAVTLPGQPLEGPPNQALEKIIETALHERKYLNQSQFDEYCKKRNLYFEKHLMALESVVYQLSTKIKETTTFVPLLVKHFGQVSESHKAFIDSCKSINVFKYLLDEEEEKKKERHEWFPQFMRGIKLLMNLKDETSARHKTMDNYIVGDVIPGLEKSLKAFTKSLHETKKIVEKHKDKYQDAEEATQKRIKKIQKMFEAEENKKDWLAEELAAFTDMDKSKQCLTHFGRSISEYWREVVKEEKALAQAIQKVINLLLANYKEVNTVSKEFQGYILFWETLNLDQEVDNKLSVDNVMSLSSLDFMKSTLRVLQILKERYTLEDFETFNDIKVEEQIFGNKTEIISSLIVKRFECQREGQHNTPEGLVVYSTADHYLVFYDEKQPDKTNKMQIRRLLNTRKSEYAVNVNEKIEGFLMDSWNLEVIYFQSPDRAEEFMFHTENNADLKKNYLE